MKHYYYYLKPILFYICSVADIYNALSIKPSIHAVDSLTIKHDRECLNCTVTDTSSGLVQFKKHIYQIDLLSLCIYYKDHTVALLYKDCS